MILALILLGVLALAMGLLGWAGGYAAGLLKGFREPLFTMEEIDRARQEALFQGVMHNTDAVVSAFEDVLERRGHGELAAVRREVGPKLEEILIEKAFELGVGGPPVEGIGGNEESVG